MPPGQEIRDASSAHSVGRHDRNLNVSFSHSTIAAIATATAPSAVGILRISGPASLAIADAMTRGKASTAKERQARLCRVYDVDGCLIDETLLTVFRGPRSYTGEDVCEFAGHGGILVMRSLLDRALACGATMAGPGEFTQQAFLHGKLDLTQAEGVMDLISAQTHHALRAAHEQREGKLGRQTEIARDELLECIAHVEAYIDFPEEDISPEVGQALQKKLTAIASTLRHLLATADRGRILREGVRTVIYGAPNTGKSSLLNRLLGYERAIVSQIAGTTRDSIEESVNVGGILLRLTDTAGLRHETDDLIEQEGIRRSEKLREQADLVLALFDATRQRPPQMPSPLHEHQNVLILLNKIDCGEHASWQDTEALRISCLSGSGMEQLEEAIASLMLDRTMDDGHSLVSINARHQDCLRRALLSIEQTLPALKREEDLTLISIELRSAMHALGEIAGKIDSDDILGVIFSRFCIGK
ncbi:MAG: tRNA uridine-5-carboxymethylaminomethyl(34) synthesis GTPase MnmE [Verrucomicrobiota bacterium]|jgi:tRNA modification GTPase